MRPDSAFHGITIAGSATVSFAWRGQWWSRRERLATFTGSCRASAARYLETTTVSTSFKNAIDRIAEGLQGCRPDEPQKMPAADNLPGVGCVEATLEGIPHLVFVRGPRGSHRGDPNDALLRLEAEFRPVLARPISITRLLRRTYLLRFAT